MPIGAHLRTVWPLIQTRWSPPESLPNSQAWEESVGDGDARLTGVLTIPPSGEHPETLMVFVHGLGGSADSSYMHHLASAAVARGASCLRLNLRGADRRGSEICHAGFTRDFAAILGAESLREFASICFAGFSLGGHLCLKFGLEVEDPRVRGIAAVCSPLDLDLTVRDIDRPSRAGYRRYVLASLNEIYEQVLLGTRHARPLAEIEKIRTIRDWDRAVVVPRFGFSSPEDYYRQAAVAGRLDRLRVPALLLATEGDPMVSARSIRAGLTGRETHLEVCWSRVGGHGAFPARFSLGLDGPDGLYGQLIAWLLAHRAC